MLAQANEVICHSYCSIRISTIAWTVMRKALAISQRLSLF